MGIYHGLARMRIRFHFGKHDVHAVVVKTIAEHGLMVAVLELNNRDLTDKHPSSVRGLVAQFLVNVAASHVNGMTVLVARLVCEMGFVRADDHQSKGVSKPKFVLERCQQESNLNESHT